MKREIKQKSKTKVLKKKRTKKKTLKKNVATTLNVNLIHDIFFHFLQQNYLSLHFKKSKKKTFFFFLKRGAFL